jgi:DNA (cytosine-5)-methyltransferase 1
MKIADLDKPAFTVTENHGNTNLISSLIVCNSFSLNNSAHRPYNELNEPNHCVTTIPPSIATIHEQKYTDAINNKERDLDKPSKTIRQIPFKWLDGQHLKQKKNNQALFSNLRKFTVREQARLQSFPDSFIFFGPLSDQFVMVGNAVPPLMAYNLALAIKNQIENKEV